MEAVYRKMQNGTEYMKIMGDEETRSAVTVTTTKYGSKVAGTTNPVLIDTYHDEHISIESNQQEFAEAFGIAIENIDQFMKELV